METFMRYGPFVREFTGEFPSQRPVPRSFDVFLMRAWTDGWANSRDAGDLRGNRAHFYVTVTLKQGRNQILQIFYDPPCGEDSSHVCYLFVSFE